MTQAELAAACSIDRSAIAKIEAGSDPALATLRAIGRALGLDYRTLLPADPEHEEQVQ